MVTLPATGPERVRMSGDERRAAILEQAIWLVSEQGFSGLTVNLLARRCGLTTAGLLHHFGSKEALILALLDERDRRDRTALVEALGLTRGQELSRSEALAILTAIVARNVGQPHLVRLNAMVRAEALVPDHFAREYFKLREIRVHALFADLVRPFTAEAESTAMELMAMMHGLEAQWLRESCGFDLVAAWTKAAQKLLK